jgi:hypothetical protein
MKKWNMMEDFGYYPSRIFVFTTLYFNLNMLDLIITKIALENCDYVYELNPLYYHPLFVVFKIFAPVLLLSLYFFLYFVTKFERDRRIMGKWGLGCVMALIILCVFVCINNLYHICITGCIT